MASARSWSNSGHGSRAEALGGRRAFLGAVAIALAGSVSESSMPRSAGPSPRIAAHRGGALLWPENSLTAFRSALALGVDLVELDVHLSRDGEVVVIHDPTLERTTSGQGAVRALGWDELEKKLSHLRSRARTVGRAAGEAAGNVGEALDLLAHELKRGYEKIRSLL